LQWQQAYLQLPFSHFPTLTARWVKKQLGEYGPPPWTPFARPVAQCRVALITTAGVHRTEETPLSMEDKHGDPTYRLIPRDVSPRDLCITHDYYDHRNADKDLNIDRSENSAPWLVDMLKVAAKNTGHSANLYKYSEAEEDDHLPFLAAGVPSVDIIDLDYEPWHTAKDTLDAVSARSLQIVGDVVLAALPHIESRLTKGATLTGRGVRHKQDYTLVKAKKKLHRRHRRPAVAATH